MADPPRGPGRPRRTPSASTEVFQIRCTPEEKQRWQSKAAHSKLELAEVVRRLLDRWERGEIGLGK